MARLLVLVALSTSATSGCGSEKEGPAAEVATHRARQVAAAWDGSQAADAWRAGYYPMDEAVQLPQGGLREADKRAYQAQNYALRGELPTTRPREGRVAWASGKSLTRPLVQAQDAYTNLARARVDGLPRLTVTGAKLDEMVLTTSRGPATVPAWFFTLEGYAAPLKVAAVRPSKLPQAPIEPAGDIPVGQLAPLDRLVKIEGAERSVTVIAIHGVCDDGPAVDVLETRGSVVLSAFVKDPKTGDCTAQAKKTQVTVKLDRPVRDRVLLDAHTGRPVPYSQPNELSPSWS